MFLFSSINYVERSRFFLKDTPRYVVPYTLRVAGSVVRDLVVRIHQRGCLLSVRLHHARKYLQTRNPPKPRNHQNNKSAAGTPYESSGTSDSRNNRAQTALSQLHHFCPNLVPVKIDSYTASLDGLQLCILIILRKTSRPCTYRLLWP